MSIAADFTDDEIECLIRTAAEMVNTYEDSHDVLSTRQTEVAVKAWHIINNGSAE